MTRDKPTHDATVRAYYEAEAELRLRNPLRGRRVEMRDAFIAVLAEEQRTSVVDFGAGPGGDVMGFGAAGLRSIGFDLAIGNAELAAATGLAVVPADLAVAPVRAGSFAAGWSMSTIMHLSDRVAERAVAELVRATEPGGPIWIGVWGGDGGVRVDAETIDGHQRPFHGRRLEHNEELFGSSAIIESAARFETGGGEYQLHRLRAPS